MNKTLNEIVLLILTTQRTHGITGLYIRNGIYHNSIGGLKVSEIELRNIIKHLRFGGHPIIAGPKGYKLAQEDKELKEYIKSRKLELESELNILRKMEGKG